MGIQPALVGIVRALPLPKGFAVCELGNQEMCGGEKGVPSRPWYESLGCGCYVSIDGNGRATVTADLNLPVVQLFGQFDLVTDFGTGEHIFDQAQVWRTLHDLVKPGGYIAFDRPAQGYDKHCFYLTNECLFRDIAAANGYEVLRLERATMPRGELIRGVFRRPATRDRFRVPQQGRYRAELVIA
jgi:SAM-dependent methyltransferase